MCIKDAKLTFIEKMYFLNFPPAILHHHLHEECYIAFSGANIEIPFLNEILPPINPLTLRSSKLFWPKNW